MVQAKSGGLLGRRKPQLHHDFSPVPFFINMTHYEKPFRFESYCY